MKDSLITPNRETEPMLIGAAKLPSRSDNWAMNVFENPNAFPLASKFTTIVEPAQKVPLMGSVTKLPPATSAISSMDVSSEQIKSFEVSASFEWILFSIKELPVRGTDVKKAIENKIK